MKFIDLFQKKSLNTFKKQEMLLNAVICLSKISLLFFNKVNLILRIENIYLN